MKAANVVSSVDKCMKSVLNDIHGYLTPENGGLRVQYDFKILSGSPVSAQGKYGVLIQKSPKDSLVIRDRDIVLGVSDISKTTKISDLLCDVFTAIIAQESSQVQHFAMKRKSDHEYMKVVKYASNYRISYSLLNGDSENHVIKSQMDKLIEYMKPFFDMLCGFSEFKQNAQIREFSELRMKPKFNVDHHEVHPDMFPQFMNTAGWASALSNETEINLITYVPHASIRPLVIMNNEGSANELNALTIPQSGGLVILNTDSTEVGINMWKQIVPIWIQQLRELFNIRPLIENLHIVQNLQSKYALTVTIENSKNGITLMEFDSLMRQRIAENVYNAVDTLHSLDRMLKKLTNMAVGDHIEERIAEALKYLQVTGETSTNLPQLFEASRLAADASESAFFDPTMTSLLYFPNEHLLAVYLPFLFPVAVPYVSSIIKYIKTKNFIDL